MPKSNKDRQVEEGRREGGATCRQQVSGVFLRSRRTGDGPDCRQRDVFEVTVPLERNHRYRYRYLIDGHRWENDWNADEYVPNAHGGDDSVSGPFR
jgi:hypothetical protein